ncbi:MULTISPECIES: cytochrome C oxidase subunit IV family protein [Rhizobium]|uniref:Nitric oxide reductase NorF protein n=1 Tax=Rhizobium paranaense TaxID=1650438 RepID=A0A7W8XXB9_9HYPH|nr:cytochrome C oxidase subunit IV family protein [Rhizobium paranaense]MBB5577315.1 nitric oxide reductase NorF protein [Rhizobium paranaense]
MKFHRDETALTQTFALLVLLTAGVLASSWYLTGAMPKYLLPALIASMIVAKVRLVVLDFLDLRRSRSPIGPALIAWAAAILLLALARPLVLAVWQ